MELEQVQPITNYLPSTVNQNYMNSQIQQRPLPNVPISQQQQQQQHYAKTIYETPMSTMNNRLLPPSLNQQQSPTNICRSNSQDQLHTANIQTKSRALYCNNQNTLNSVGQNMNGSSTAMLHAQHSKQYSINYSTYPHYQIQPQQQQQQQLNCNNTASRRALHLSLSSSSPSPSLGSTTLSTMANTLQQQQQQHLYSQPHQQQQQQQHQMFYKQIPANSIYGQIRTNSNHLLQPSISYQNLHYNNELSAAFSGDAMQKKSPTGPNSNIIYNRPMTSIGIMPPNSNYASLLRSDSNETGSKLESISKINYSPITNESIALQSGFISIPNTQSMQQHSSRPVNFSSSSSTSLPSTPEHSQFPYKLPPATMIKSATTTSAMNRNPIVDQTGSTTADPIIELYGSSAGGGSVVNIGTYELKKR